MGRRESAGCNNGCVCGAAASLIPGCFVEPPSASRTLPSPDVPPPTPTSNPPPPHCLPAPCPSPHTPLSQSLHHNDRGADFRTHALDASHDDNKGAQRSDRMRDRLVASNQSPEPSTLICMMCGDWLRQL